MSPTPEPNPPGTPPEPKPSVGATLKAAGLSTTGFVSIAALISLVDATTLTRIFAVAVAFLLLCNAVRIWIQIWLGRYLKWRPSRIADPVLANGRTKLNWLVAADIVVTLLGIAGAVALYLVPDAPLLCKTIPELVLCVALFAIAFGAAGWVDEIPSLSTGTEIVKTETRFGRWLYKRAQDEFDGPQDEPTFPPARDLYRFLTSTQRPARTSMTVVALSLTILLIPLAEICAHAGRALTDTIRPVQPPPGTGTEDGEGAARGKDDAGGQRPSEDRERPDETAPSARVEDCVTYTEAGRGAPPLRRSELHGLWNGRPATPQLPGILGFGWREAGCPPGQARPVRGQAEVWYEKGLCGGELRGLGIAVAGRAPAMLFQQAARFGLAEADAGRLLGAYPREDIDDGDLYVVDVEVTPGVDGSYVLIRDQKSGGLDRKASAASACRDPEDANVPYAVVPPGLLPLWRRVVAEKGWAWPKDAGSGAAAGGDVTFMDDYPSGGKPVARASCASATHCTLWMGGEIHETDQGAGDGALVTTPQAIAALRIEAPRV